MRPCIVLLALLCFLAPRLRPANLPPGFSEQEAARPISDPTAMALAPDGRVFICLQGGQLRVFKHGVLLPQPFVSVDTDPMGERGLLGVALDPSFEANGYVYIYYTARTPSPHNRVARYTAQGDVAAPGSERILLELENLSIATNHNGGAIHFGGDGKLYVATGENGQGSNAQSLSNKLGKLLRMNPDGGVPTDNPFYASASGSNRLIWALGLRNPFTFAVQPGSGRIYINDVGLDLWEEINEGAPGANYGWPDSEGPTSTPGHTGPIHAYNHDGGACSIVAGSFYNPASPTFPAAWRGKYFFGDLCAGVMRTYDPASGALQTFGDGFHQMVDSKAADNGELWVLQRGGDGILFRIWYNASHSPHISSHPAGATVTAGTPASFRVTASGTAPLSYQWQRNGAEIPGATGAAYTLSPAQLSDDGALFRVIVRNSYGAATSAEARLHVTPNRPPTPLISLPAPSERYNAGEAVSFSGSASDPEDGTLAASRLSWTLRFFHDDGTPHEHPFFGPMSGSGASIVIPQAGEASANVAYRFYLTATDGQGLSATAMRQMLPNTAVISVQASQPGLTLTLDGQPFAAPFSRSSVVGMLRELGAPGLQFHGGLNWRFASWSDGGGQVHSISTPASAFTYMASFVSETAVPSPSFTASPSFSPSPTRSATPPPPGSSPTVTPSPTPAPVSGMDRLLEYALSTAPNPAASRALLRYLLLLSGEAELQVMDVSGAWVRRVKLGQQPAGSGELWLDVSGLSEGIYFAQITVDGWPKVKAKFAVQRRR